MKRIISMFLVFAMILSLSSIALAAEAEKDFIIDEENTTVQILTSEGWDYIAKEGDYNSWTIEVLADIDATTAFGTFTGTLVGNKDGGKPTITNNINSGLISTLATGTVKDLIIAGSITVEEGSYCGSLVDKICDTTTASNILISGIENNCSVTLQSGGGAGMIGRLAYNTRSAGNAYTVTIIDCVNNAAMSTSGAYCGGIIGALNAPTKAIEGDKITVENCDNYGTISGGEYVGGIISGYATAHNATYSFTDCSNYGTITGTKYLGGISAAPFGTKTIVRRCANYADVNGTSTFIGGIIATVNSLDMSESFNKGEVKGSSNYIGGLVGRTNGTVVSITDSYNTGNVQGTEKSTVGGVVGTFYVAPTNIIFKNVYTTGTVPSGIRRITGNLKTTSDSTPEVSNIYYLETLAGADEVSAVSSVVGTLLADTKAGFEKLPDGFSDTIWASLEGGYPILKNNLPTEANGTPITYHTVTLDNGENGTAYKDTVTYVKEGTSYTLTVKPNDDYQVDEVTNLTSIGDNRYQTETVTSDMTVSVTYKAIPQDEDEITSAETPFSSDAFESDDGTVNAVNLVQFARFAVKDGVTAIYGIQLSNDNFVTVLNEGLADSDYNGQYGVRFYGTKIIKGNTYYLRPYVSYDDGLTYTYGEIVIYTIPVNN